MLKYVSNVEGAPAAIGPYSQAVIADNLMFLSGQIPINPTTGKIDSDDIAIQAKQVLQNIFAVLSDQGFSFKNVVKATIFLTDLSNFQIVNEIYESFLA
ncbi:MAG: Rid family detoxifying hydrolase, partial [bacterium]|nr:Rid family detoxifying hydrolase [bacterium]